MKSIYKVAIKPSNKEFHEKCLSELEKYIKNKGSVLNIYSYHTQLGNDNVTYMIWLLNPLIPNDKLIDGSHIIIKDNDNELSINSLYKTVNINNENVLDLLIKETKGLLEFTNSKPEKPNTLKELINEMENKK